MASLSRATVQVPSCLLDAIADRALEALAANLAFDRDPARLAALRPDDEQVGASSSEAILPFHAPAAIDDPLQERLQQELRGGLLVVEPFDPKLGVLAEEGLEGR